MADADHETLHSMPVHMAGITRLCFSPDGDTIFTGGVDSLVRIHKANDPSSEPGFHDEHEDAITSLTCSSSNLITACADNIARIFSYPDNRYTGFLTRATAVPIRWVSVDKKGERVAVVSDDLLVKVINVQDTSKVTFLSDNVKAVRSASWDPSGEHLVTVGSDGRVKVYDLTADAAVHLRNIDGVISPSKSDSPVSAYAAWHPSGKFFALPLRTNDIGIYSSGTWQKETTFSQDGHKGVISELAFSPNGRYLASSSGNQILIWETESRTVIARLQSPGLDICGLAWSPSINMIAYTALDGQFTRWTDPVPKNLTSPVATEQQEKRRVDRLLDDDDGDVDMDDRGEDLGDGEDGEEGDWIVDDEGDYGADDVKWGKGRTEVVNVTKAQPAFTPGSTAYKGKKRYMAFNMIGVVDCTDTDTHQVINVEFHDKSTRRGYHFQDHTGYTMASLGEQGIAYAAPTSEDGPSTINYRPYDSWATQSDWTQTFPAGESATCIAVGGPPDGAGVGSVVVATTRGMVRFFTASGVQRYVWTLGEDVVCMAAGRDGLVVVYREGGTSLDGCQNLRYTILDLDSFDMLQQGRIPLQRKVNLTWLGWSSEGSPVMADSTGIISQLDRYRRPGQGRWVPILDGAAHKRETKGETYWPVGISESSLSCILLKANEKEPWFPRPLLQNVDLQVPLLGMDGQAGKLEESHLNLSMQTSTLSSSSDYDAKQTRVTIDKELLQLIQSACKSDNLARAFDLASLLLNPGSVDGAAKIAAFYHLGGLEERILGLKGEAAVRARREEKRNKEREKERERRYGADHTVVNGAATAGPAGKGGMDLGFQPRDKPRRSFGGVKAATAAASRAETPQNSLGTGRGTYIPETPTGLDGVEDSYLGRETESFDDIARQGSPEGKRKRGDQEEFAPRRKLEEVSMSNGSTAGKNPFAKKTAAGNPFAKPPASKPLDAIKSKSFFARVDDIESTGTTKPKSKNIAKAPESARQTTLLGLKKASDPAVGRPSIHHASSTETEVTEMDDSEMDTDSMPPPPAAKRNGVIVEETQLVDEPEEETQVDDEAQGHGQAPEREGSPEWGDDDEETFI